MNTNTPPTTPEAKQPQNPHLSKTRMIPLAGKSIQQLRVLARRYPDQVGIIQDHLQARFARGNEVLGRKLAKQTIAEVNKEAKGDTKKAAELLRARIESIRQTAPVV